MRRAWIVVLALLLGGCRSVPEPAAPELPVEAPPAFTAEGEGEKLPLTGTWWRDFDDPMLDGYVREALLKNPALDEAEARVRAALALAEIAGADLLPHLNANQSISRNNAYLGEPLQPGAPSTLVTDRFGVSLNLSWEWDVWGRIRAGEAASLADVEAQQALLHGAALSLATQISKAYFSVVEAENQVKVAENQLASASSLASRIRRRFERGLRGALDVKLAETEVADAETSVFFRRRLADGARRQLETLAARYPSGTAEVAAGLPELPKPVAAGIPADIVRNRPDLVAAERFLASTGYRVSEAEAGLYPRIALTASGGLASADLAGLLSGDFAVWSLAQNLVAPIYQGGRLRANVRRTEATREEAAAAFAGRALVAFSEVETALAAEHFLLDQTKSLRALVRETEASVTLSQSRYLAGLGSILAVLEARRRDFGARSLLLRSRLDRIVTRVDLIAALGGGTNLEAIGS